jgi:biopolymer transport protein TolR
MDLDAGRREGPAASINVTPMADVVSVLLIIFMVVTPKLDDVDLPGARHGHAGKGRIGVTITSRGVRIDQGQPLARTAIEATMRGRLEELPEAEVDVRADRDLPYAMVMGVLDACRRAGADEVSLVTRVENGGLTQ